MRRLSVLALAAVLAGVPLAAGHAAGPPRPRGLLVGAATVGVTPPPAGTRPDPAGCVPVDGAAAVYNGPRQFALEEPYVDVLGDGHYDPPDPTTGFPGDPFLDCPTPTATGGLRPPDGRWDGIYLGGGNCCDRLANRVLDPLEADAMVVSDGRHRIAVVTVDNEGVFKEIWDEVRAKVAADGVHLDAIFPSSTHDESAPDTIGITGPNQVTSGVDPFYVEYLVRQVATAVERAAAHLTPARIRYGSTHADTLLPCWSSYPFTADESVGAMQAVAPDGRVLATLVNYGIHAEELGFAKATQHDVSADWWQFLRRAVRARYGPAPVLSMAGMVGSVEMPLVLSGGYDPVPTAVHQFASVDGCTTVYSAPPGVHQVVAHEGGYSTYTVTLGRTVAGYAERALATGAWSTSARLAFALRTISTPVTNLLFLAAGPACVFDYRLFYVHGVPTGTGLPPACGAGDEIATDVGYFRIGDGSFVLAPGELFPLTYAHDFHGPDGLAAPAAGPVHGWVLARLGGRWRFVDGLGGDLSGYIFPASNEVGTPTTANPAGDDVDRFGCHHVDDAEASSGQEGDVVDDALAALLPPSQADSVRVGRYLDAAGGLHRNPAGDGILGCDPGVATFRPDGGAVAVLADPPGRSGFDAAAATEYVPGRAGVRWMDLLGRPQAAPSQQTRGVILPDGQRIWLDVYPG